jgi:hypothetical protein
MPSGLLAVLIVYSISKRMVWILLDLVLTLGNLILCVRAKCALMLEGHVFCATFIQNYIADGVIV